MSRLDCERWVSLLDRQALEDLPSAEDARFQLEHVRGCPACAREQAVWQKLDTLHETATDEVERDVMLEDAALKTLWSVKPPRLVGFTPAKRRIAVLSGALALAAGTLLFFLQRPSAPDVQATVAHMTIGSGKAVGPAGAVRRAGELVRAGETLRATDSALCLVIEAGVRACLSPGGELRVADVALSQRRIELLRGRLVASLEPQPAGTTFSVSTRTALVTAVGTIFAVEVGPKDDQVLVRVLRGAVSVRAAGATPRILRAHQSLTFGAETPGDLDAHQEEQDLALLRLEPEAAPASSGADITAPLASSDPGTAGTAVESAAPPAASATEPISAAALLRQALELRGRSRFAEAAQVYGKLLSSHRSSPEARAALVSLGDLQLSRLNNAAGALRSFEAYLAQGDPALRQEAEYGRIRALRALGRAAQERIAIERLLERFPSGVHADSMRARLQSLKGDGSH